MNGERKIIVVLIEIFSIVPLVYLAGVSVPGLGRGKCRMIVDTL
jgi:hypothetical protein